MSEHNPARPRLTLDGTWTFATDPLDRGQAEGWETHPGFDRPTEVPAPWQLMGGELLSYTGVAWYHRSFDAPAAGPDQVVWLGFDAVDYHATAWVNGTRLGTHEGGYTPFGFALPAGLLRASGNHLVLRVLDPADNSEIPHGKQGSWYTRVSGPWQPVWLETRARTHVQALHVTPEPQNGRAIGVPPFPAVIARVRVTGDPQAEVRLTVRDPDGQIIAEGLTQGDGEVTLAMPDTRLWSPDDPALHTLEATLGADRLATRFGMRWVERRDGLVYLNGKPLYLRGALDQGFWPETVYRPTSVAAIEHELGAAKAMGLNMLRKHIKLEDPRWLDACDRLGMLVWAEPACFYKSTARGQARFRAELKAMLDRDFNHPSVIAWSLYNEEWGLEWRLGRDPEKQDHVAALMAWAREADPTRLWCDNSGWAHVDTDLNDWHRYYAAPDQQAAWEADLARCVQEPGANFVAGRAAASHGVPVLVSEFGMWGLSTPSRILEREGGRPAWFEARWEGHTEAFKSPATAERNGPRFGLDRLFGGPDGLAAASQARMLAGLKALIEPMRRQPHLAGYVVTELTDIEWETNGWLDYYREPKAPPAAFAAFNGPVVVMCELARHTLWDSARIAGLFWVSNHTAKALSGTIRWRLAELSGELAVAIAPYASVPVGRLSAAAPRVSGHAALRLDFELLVDGQVVATNHEDLHVVAQALATNAGLPTTYLHGAAGDLTEALGAAGLDVHGTPAPGLPWLACRYDDALDAHLQAGGRALLVAANGDDDLAAGFLSCRRLPPGESWDRAASLNWLDPAWFPDLALAAIPGWAWEGIYPAHALPLTEYLHDFGGRPLALTGNQAHLGPERLMAGYFEGWVGKVAATIARVPVGRGELLVTTLPLLGAYGRQPIATAMLHRLLTLAPHG